MTIRFFGRAAIAAMGLSCGLSSGAVRCDDAFAVSVSSHHSPSKESKHMHASGSFEVKLTPQPLAPEIASARLGIMTIDKQFSGDLQASSLGEMLSAMGDVAGSAGYVAMERVTGSLHGRAGSFVLQHTGTMHRGAPQLSVSVVPDSGTGELAGLSGSMAIQIEQGRHSYTFDYSLP
jgi:hypothetical protein